MFYVISMLLLVHSSCYCYVITLYMLCYVPYALYLDTSILCILAGKQKNQVTKMVKISFVIPSYIDGTLQSYRKYPVIVSCSCML